MKNLRASESRQAERKNKNSFPADADAQSIDAGDNNCEDESKDL